MKIRISTLPAQGITLTEKLSLEELNARMAEGRENDIAFTTPPEATVKIHRTASGAETTGIVKAMCTQPCSRCATTVERTVEAETNYTFLQIPEDAEAGASFEDDVGLSYYEGDYIELDGLIQESLILQLARYWHPEENDRGECSLCGLNVSDFEEGEQEEPKTKLGSLLKKAGVKVN